MSDVCTKGIWDEGWMTGLREGREESKAVVTALLEALNLAVSALEAVDENHLGTASDANSEWPIRDEVLSKLRAAMAKAP